jgi:DNA helicase HerA-like ATPase
MARLHAGIIALCLIALTCTAHADIGTVRLLENHLLFASPATATDKLNQYVKVICKSDEANSSRIVTNDPTQPLFYASTGETLTILEVIRCADLNNGAYVKARAMQNVVGYTQLPNYHTRIQTTDAEGAYQVLFLMVPSCILTQFHDPECRVSGYADPFANYARLNPTSPRASKAAEFAAAQYKYAADTLRYIAETGGHPNLPTYTTRYTRPALITKANEYRALENQMQILASNAPAQQQTASSQSPTRPAASSTPPQQTTPAPQTAATQPATINDHTVNDPKFPDFRKPKLQPAATAQPTPPAPSQTLSDILIPIFYALLSTLALAYIILYPIRYKRISTPLPLDSVPNSIVEGIVLLALAAGIAYFLSDYLNPFVLIALALVLYLRLEARLEPARKQCAEQRAEAELQRKQETFKALIPLLDQLHRTYGRYSDMPDCVPADWYAPRRHYIEYMADLLYTHHTEYNPHILAQHSITADSYPLVKLRWLYLPRYELKPADLQDPRHPYHVIMHAITDPTDPDHIIFRDLIPVNTDLLSYLQAQSWRQPLERQAQELELLVTQGITKEQYVIIGIPPNRDQYPLPVFYRDQRFRHTYVIGKTGSGKSTLLRNLIAQDIHYNNGLIVLSPENDLFERLLAFIPPERKDDLIYFDPTDTKPPIIGFNPLALEAGEDLTQKAGETMTALKRALGDLGVTMEPLIQNAVYALLQRPESTFADLARLIDPHDLKLRSAVKNDPNIDEATRTFWQRYERSTYYQKSFEAVLNRLNPFFRPPISTILATPSLSFKTELNQDRRIIFLNLSRLRGMEAATIGQLLLAEIQQSLLVRDELPEDSRIPYFLYIDEFQTYAGDSEQSLITILNGARKYKLGITLAHQTTSDIPSRLLSTIVGNVGTVISLQIAAEDAPFFARELQIKRDGKDSYSAEALQNLTTGYGYARTPNYSHGVFIAVPAKPVVALPDPIPTDELKSASKKNFGLLPKTEPQEPDTADIGIFPRDFDPVTPDDEPVPHKHAAEPDTATAVLPLEPVAPIAEAAAVAEPAKRKRSATPRQARKPVVRNTIKKKSLIPDESIEIE